MRGGLAAARGKAGAVVLAREHDHLGVGLQSQDFRKRRESLVGAVRIRRQAEVERDPGWLMRAERFDRLKLAAKDMRVTAAEIDGAAKACAPAS